MFGFEYNLLDDAPYVHSAHHDLVISNQTPFLKRLSFAPQTEVSSNTSKPPDDKRKDPRQKERISNGHCPI